MGDLTENISRYEIACKCGCGKNTIDFFTVMMVQGACDFFSKKLGRRVTLDISSGSRCPFWNAHEGGGDKSQHLESRAIDHKIREVSVDELFDYYLAKYPMIYGFGKYPTFVHVDSRSGIAWVGRKA